MRQRNRATFLSALAATALLLAACGGDDDDGDAAPEGDDVEAGEEDLDTDDDADEAADDADDADAAAPDGPTIVVRGQDFSEAATLAEVYGQYLEARGYDVDIQTPAGFRVEAIDGIRNGELGLIVDYIGGSQTELAPDTEPSGDPDEVMEIIEPEFADIGGTILDYTPAVDGDAFVVREDEDATTISDVADLDLVFGASAQCFERPQCFLGYTDPDVYGIEFADTTTIEFGPLLGEALSAGEVDAVVWNDTAPQIDELGFKVLEDDLGLHPAQNIAPIVLTEVLEAYGDQLAADLNELSAMIATEDLLAWNVETDLEFRESDDVATEWLEDNGLL
jgi:osmoprotectant transport system substrate-binding protein